jgi:prepilin peptidase CpaA
MTALATVKLLAFLAAFGEAVSTYLFTITALKFAAMVTMLVLAVATDLSERRIPNKLTVSGAIAALLISTIEVGGIPASSMLGLVTALAVTIPLFALGALGAGDAKLLAAVGAYTGIGGLLPVVLYSGVAGGVLAIVTATRRGVILPVLLQTRGVLMHTISFGRYGSRTTIDDPDAHTIPYGVAIAVGSVVAFFFPFSLWVTP